MNLERINRGSAAAVGFLLVSGIFAALAVGVKLSSPCRRLMPTGAPSAARRSRKSARPRKKRLTTAAVIDAQRGIVRLPIDDGHETGRAGVAESRRRPRRLEGARRKSRGGTAEGPGKTQRF